MTPARVDPSEDLRRLAQLRQTGHLDTSACREDLSRAGFADGRAATEALDQYLDAPAADTPADALLAACGSSADPDRALLNAVRLLGLTPRSERPERAVDLAHLAAFLGASQHMADLLHRRPDLLATLGEPFDADGAVERYVTAGAGGDRERALRLTQQADLIAIAWMDMIDGEDIEHVTSMISRLADAAVIGAARGLGADERFAIIGFGKLGGYELNYSSDIDLIFVRPDDVTDGASADRTARAFVQLLGRQTADGHLYRVDMRLRPEGGAGQLTRGLTSCLDYYHSTGRPWERQMLTKARVICDAGTTGAQFVEGTRQWILQCGLDHASVRQFKRLKAASEARASQQSSDDGRADIKQAPGGIRDIETVMQFLSLQHATKNPELLCPNTLQGLERLRVAGALTSLESSRLRLAYRFHRRVENLLQVMHRVQTHRLPEHREALARLMGRRDVEAFDSELGEHQRRVRDIFERHFLRPFADIEGEAAHLADWFLDPRGGREKALLALEALGFHQPQASFDVLERASTPVSRFLPASPRLLSAFADVAPKLLERLALQPDADTALDRFERMTRGVGAREVLYQQLAAEPQLLEMLCDLAGGSPYLADILIHQAHIFDDFVDALLTGERGQRVRRRLLDELGAATAGDPWLVLNDHRQLELLRIGLLDLTDLTPTRETLGDLSQLCIDVLRHAFNVIGSSARRTWGDPMSVRGLSAKVSAGMVVLAMGKVGGMEANYASDADLVFIYSGDGNTDQGVENRIFFTRVAEELIAHVGGNKGGPRLYKIDTRLRPEGNKGPLVMSLKAFEAYYRGPRAALFEFQALLKARVVAGDAALGQKVLALTRTLVRRYDIPHDLAERMRTMRGKIEAAAPERDLKRGTGGMIDIEFLTQHLQLVHAAQHPSLLVPETPRALEIAAGLTVLPVRVAHWLRDTYLFFRRVETRLQIAMGLDTKEVPTDPAALRSLALRLGYADAAEGDAGHQLLVDLEDSAKETRAWYDRLLV